MMQQHIYIDFQEKPEMIEEVFLKKLFLESLVVNSFPLDLQLFHSYLTHHFRTEESEGVYHAE